MGTPYSYEVLYGDKSLRVRVLCLLVPLVATGEVSYQQSTGTCHCGKQFYNRNHSLIDQRTPRVRSRYLPIDVLNGCSSRTLVLDLEHFYLKKTRILTSTRTSPESTTRSLNGVCEIHNLEPSLTRHGTEIKRCPDKIANTRFGPSEAPNARHKHTTVSPPNQTSASTE